MLDKLQLLHVYVLRARLLESVTIVEDEVVMLEEGETVDLFFDAPFFFELNFNAPSFGFGFAFVLSFFSGCFLDAADALRFDPLDSFVTDLVTDLLSIFFIRCNGTEAVEPSSNRHSKFH